MGRWPVVWCSMCARETTGTVIGCRILSAYKLAGGNRLWVITEADRSVTTLLLPSEC